jgi:hypothetical protein
MLNCLRITDLAQVAGLLLPRDIVIVGSMPDSYEWAKRLYETLGEPNAFQNVESFSKWRPSSL